ncbi:MAG: MmcQ/YjbR family DNA-binding protein [Sandaracinaceae bacterium]
MALALPETKETISHGAPTFWGGKRTFAVYHDGHYDGGHIGVWIKAEEGVQASLVESDPARFYRPKYLGPSGWVGVRLDERVEWEQVRFLLSEGWRTVAPARAIAALEIDGVADD